MKKYKTLWKYCWFVLPAVILLTGCTAPLSKDAPKKSDETAICQHEYGEWVTEKEATCTDDGEQIRICKLCSEKEVEIIQVLGHHFGEYLSDENATCLVDGTKTAQCERCTATNTVADEDSALGHRFETYVSDGNATCLVDGTKTAQCERCTATDTVADEDSALGHRFEIYVSDGNATCLVDGTKTAQCERCNATDTVADEDSRLPHPFVNNVCPNCGEIENRLLPESVGDFILSKNQTDEPMLSLTVANAKSEIAFDTQISVYEDCSWSISQDEDGLIPLSKEAVTLSIGTQTFYLTVSYGNEKAVYPVSVRRLDSYEYTFTVDGEDFIPSSSIETPDYVNKPKDPEKVGYIFVGWAVEGSVVTFPYYVEKSTQFVALWDTIEYEITYLLVCAEEMSENPISYTVEDNILLASPSRSGYAFLGWYFDEEMKLPTSGISKGSTGSKTFFAKWETVRYAIEYEVNGGKNAAENPAFYTVEDRIALSAPTKVGYDFAGWYIDEALSTPCAEIPLGSTGDKVLYAKWTLATYTLQYILNGGKTIRPNPSNYTSEDEITLKSPIRSGYTFAGWYADSALSEPVSKTIAKGSIGNKIFYAKWTPSSYIISYQLNGGTNAKSNPTSYTTGDPEFIFDAATRTGCSFVGWYTDPEFTVAIDRIHEGAFGDLTLYARFTCLGLHSFNIQQAYTDSASLICYACGEKITVSSPLAYSTFGAVGDGETDDSTAIRKTHEMANLLHYNVEADAGKTYYIPKIDSPAVIRTNTDWKDATFIIDDTTVSHLDASARSKEIFEVKPDTASVSLKVPAGMTLVKGQTNIGMTFSEDCLLHIVNSNKKDFVRYGENASSGANRQEIIIVDKNGNVDPSTPIQYDYTAVTALTQYSLNETPITVKGGKFITIANDPKAIESTYTNQYLYYSRGIRCYRSNTTFIGIDHVVTNEKYTSDRLTSFGAPYASFYGTNYCANVTYRDCGAYSHHEYGFYMPDGVTYNGMGSYDVTGTAAVNLTYENLVQHNDITDRVNLHGLMGTNYCRNVVLRNCYIDRFDAHTGLYNVSIYNSTLGFNLYVCGGGLCYAENVTRLSGTQFMAMRSDYGSIFDGDVILKNCTFETNNINPCIIGGTWYEYDFKQPDVFTVNVTLDNFVFAGTVGAVFHFTGAKESSLTNATNPLIPPKTLTYQNMTVYPIASTADMKAVLKNLVITKENVTEPIPFHTSFENGYEGAQHGGTGFEEKILTEGSDNSFLRITRIANTSSYYFNILANQLIGNSAQNTSQYPTGDIVIDFEVRATSSTMASQIMMVGFKSNGDKVYDSLLEITSSGTVKTGSAAGYLRTTLVSSLSSTTWTRITIVLHNNATRTADYYVNGTLASSGKTVSSSAVYYSYMHIDASKTSELNRCIDFDNIAILFALPNFG